MLAVDEAAAKALGVNAGPLTAKRLQAILTAADGSGVAQQLRDRANASTATAKLAVLLKVLVPEPERQAITEGKLKRLIVVPDGPLALLPFETLVVSPGEQPKYLLDVGPPVIYGPSATVLYNLQTRPRTAATSAAEPVLSVGDPAYPTAPTALAAADSALGALSAASRYRSAGGQLSRLPHSGLETLWVSRVFQDEGISSVRLVGEAATKANVRANAAGRQVVHLACHGRVDTSYGNFYGALALAPGQQASSNPADDGFLTLAEICQLDLKGCELAILSACDTNAGPQQRGEGSWALSRGFLVAGARRVVASNWLVDDQAAATLVSYFCGGVAQAQKGGPVDYCQALHNAKRWVRQQDKWKSPYYWGTFVLVGPP
jgi:CHAT domain-containing protein